MSNSKIDVHACIFFLPVVNVDNCGKKSLEIYLGNENTENICFYLRNAIIVKNVNNVNKKSTQLALK